MFNFCSNGIWLLAFGLWTVAYALSDIKTPNKTWDTNKTWEVTKGSLRNDLKPSEWISMENLNALPALNDISWDLLLKLPTIKASKFVHKLYHLSKLTNKVEATFVPSPKKIPCFLINSNNERVNFNLNELVTTVNDQNDFAKHQLTIIVSGLPEQIDSVKKAHKELLEAYITRYTGVIDKSYTKFNMIMKKNTLGNVVVIDLGSVVNSVMDMVTLNVQKMGAILGNILVQLTEKMDVPPEIIHVIGENMAAHVVGVAGRQYQRITGLRLRRITGLDPFKLLPKYNNILTGLARGDAEFVDVIHTSINAMGMKQRSGDVDFYPNGLEDEDTSEDSNIIEKAMMATRLFAESIIPGNEYNFPALTATSLDEYHSYEGGAVKRAYMGINTGYDLKGDFILEVNKKSPFGRGLVTPTKKINRFINLSKILTFDYVS